MTPTSTNTTDDPDKHLPAPMRESMTVLRELQAEHDRLYNEYNMKRRQLEETYEKLYNPLFEKRREELERGNISSFWLTALDNCKVVGENITDRDRGALEFLKHLEYTTISNTTDEYPAGTIILKFWFSPNPFFTNEVLTKTYVMDPEDDEELKKTIGTDIVWKPGKNLTVKMMKKKNKNRGNGKVGSKVTTKIEACDSFFNFFSPPKEEDVVSPEEIEALDALVAADFEIGETICSEVISRAVLWYADEVHDSEEEEDVGGDDGDDDEEGDDEEGDEDDGENDDDGNGDDDDGGDDNTANDP